MIALCRNELRFRRALRRISWRNGTSALAAVAAGGVKAEKGATSCRPNMGLQQNDGHPQQPGDDPAAREDQAENRA